MKIEGNVKTDNILTVDDLYNGEVFVFKDNPNYVFLKTDESELIVNLKSGELDELSCNEANYRAVERVKCKLIIE